MKVRKIGLIRLFIILTTTASLFGCSRFPAMSTLEMNTSESRIENKDKQTPIISTSLDSDTYNVDEYLRENSIPVTADKLVSEIERNTEFATSVYEFKYLKLTGEIVDITQSMDITGIFFINPSKSDKPNIACFISPPTTELEIGDIVTIIGYTQKIGQKTELTYCEIN